MYENLSFSSEQVSFIITAEAQSEHSIAIKVGETSQAALDSGLDAFLDLTDRYVTITGYGEGAVLGYRELMGILYSFTKAGKFPWKSILIPAELRLTPREEIEIKASSPKAKYEAKQVIATMPVNQPSSTPLKDRYAGRFNRSSRHDYMD